MFKWITGFLSTTFLASPIGNLFNQPADLDLSIRYLDDDFVRQGYEEQVYQIKKEGELNASYTNNEQQILINQGLIATRDLQYETAYQYHQANFYGGGESGFNVVDTAFVPSVEVWKLTKHLVNYDHLDPAEKLVSLSENEYLANPDQRFFQFKLLVNFSFTLNNQTYQYSGEFTPRYTYHAGVLTNQESYLLKGPQLNLFNQDYQPQLFFEPVLSVHEHKKYWENSLAGPGIMPRFWITGPYNEAYFQNLRLNVPRNNETYALLTTKVETFSFFQQIKVLDFTHAQPIELNLDFDPTKNQPLLNGEALYNYVQEFVKVNFVHSSTIKLYYENLRSVDWPFFNHQNRLTTFCFPISFFDSPNGQNSYQQKIGNPFVKVNLYKKIDLLQIKWPAEIAYQTQAELKANIEQLLTKNFLNEGDVLCEIKDENLVLRGNHLKITNQITIPLNKLSTDPDPTPKPEPEPKPDIPEEPNSKEPSISPSKHNQNQRWKLLSLLLPLTLLLLSLPIIWHYIKKKKKR